MTEQMVYELRVDGKMMGQFSSKSKALAEKKKYVRANIVTTWVDVPDQPKEKKKPTAKKETPKKEKPAKPRKEAKKSIFKKEKKPVAKKKSVETVPELKPTEDMPVNTWLRYRNLEPVERDLTFHQIYVAIVVDSYTLEDALGDCKGRKAEILRALEEAMDHPVITVRYLEDRLEENKKNRVKEVWTSPSGWWTVSSGVAQDFKKYWSSINEPYFLAAYSNRAQCDPNIRDSDLSVQPFKDGLAVCYRDLRDDKVYLVSKKIEWVDLGVNYLEIHGKDKNNRPMKLTLNYDDVPGAAKNRKKLIEAGWYKVDDEYYVHLRQMKKGAPAGFVSMETVAAYPGFNKTEFQKRVAYFDLTWNIMDFMQDKFSASSLEYIECPDSVKNDIYAMPEVLEKYQRRRIY